MLNLKVEKISNGIIRIRDEKFSELLSMTERYGLVSVNLENSTDGIEFNQSTNSITLPNGRVLKISFKSDDDSFWKENSEYFTKKFEEHYLRDGFVEGSTDYHPVLPKRTPRDDIPGDGFGVIFDIEDKERFYGLGEAATDRIELRGKSYQNYASYQFDEIPIPFFMSSDGWGVLINAYARNFVDVGERFNDKLIISGDKDYLDIFVLYGTMPEMLKHYAKLTGKSMVLPGWAYGLNYIAPINADQFEVMRQAERIRQEKIGCDMISLEPRWMETFYDYSTNPEWNLEKFHMPKWLVRRGRTTEETFIAALRRMGFHTSLWFCDYYDYSDEAERVFRGDDYNEFEPWYQHIGQFTHCGVDAFKLDPSDTLGRIEESVVYANGLPQKLMHNLNQVLITKQTYEGFAKQTGMRPMHHYSGGYIGTQKWGAATTGDNGGEHGAMIWLLTLAMSGFSNSTIDMNVHTPASLHFGFFVPWAHLNTWQGVNQPWWAGEDNYKLFKFYNRLRYRLFPYIYSSALEAHEEAMPIVRPMPLVFPEFEKGFDNVCQYMFGPSFMVCAYSDTVNLPEGKWEDYWTGEIYDGPCDIKPVIPKDRGGALFIKRGAIIPAMANEVDCIRDYDNSVLEIDVYPEGKSEFILREDDMISLEYENKTSCHTQIICEADEDSTVITIGKSVGDYDGKPQKREFIVNVYGGSKNVKVIAEDENTSYKLIIKR